MQIHIDAKNGNVQGVSRWLEKGVSVDSIDEESKLTPLMMALGSNNTGIDMIRLLIDKGANINRLTRLEHYHTYPLAVAAQHGNLEKLKFLLKNGADLHYKTPEGYDVLIDAMSWPDFIDEYGTDLLEIIKFLLKEGAPVNGQTKLIQSSKTITALSIASDMCRYDIIKLLLEYGSNPGYLKWNKLMHAVVFGTLEETKSCLTQESLLHDRDVSKRTPFLLSVLTGDIPRADFLLSAGSNREARGYMNQTPFLYAVRNEDLEMMTWLARNNFDVNEPGGISETTPLARAVQNGSIETIKLLLALGADLNKTDGRGKRAIAQTDDPAIKNISIIHLFTYLI